MKASLLNKLDILSDRFEELTALLGDGEVISDQTKFRAYSREYSEVEPIVAAYTQLLKALADLEGAQALLKDSDPDMREMAVEEVRETKQLLADLEAQLQRMHRWRRGGDFLRRPVPHVFAVCRASRLAGGDSFRERRRARRL